MKIALYIEDGLEQIVLTPETPNERAILNNIHAGDRELTLAQGTFYGCRGGWMRHGDRAPQGFPPLPQYDDRSTFIMLRPKGGGGT